MIGKLIRKIILGEKSDSESYIKYLRKKGVQIGDDVTFFSPANTLVDVTAPWLITIGNHVRITHGAVILTHDYSWSVLKNYPDTKGGILGAQAGVSIGNNVFIGMNSVITKGVTINDNVIIGAGSVVTKDCLPHSVYAGNPARKIMTLDEFYEKRKSRQLEEARELALAYYNRYGKYPTEDVFKEYFMLFETADSATKQPLFKAQMETGDCYEETVEYMKLHPRSFASFREFLEYCFR